MYSQMLEDEGRGKMKLKEPLCRTCRQFQFSDVGYVEHHQFKQYKRSQRAYCREFFVDIEVEAKYCDKYDDKRNPEMDDMKKSAWILEKKKVIGFDHPVFEFNKPKKK